MATYFIVRATAFLSLNCDEKRFRAIRSKGSIGDLIFAECLGIFLTLGSFSFNTGESVKSGVCGRSVSHKILVLEVKLGIPPILLRRGLWKQCLLILIRFNSKT